MARTVRKFDARASQGPLAGFWIEVRETSDGEMHIDTGGFDPDEIAAYSVEKTEAILQRNHPDADRVTRDVLPSGGVYSVWATADAEDPMLVYGEETAPREALVWNGPEHKCEDHASYYESEEGALGHGYTCAVCGALLQVG